MCVYFKLELGLQTWTNDENLGRPPKHKDEIARRDPRHKQDGYPCPKVMLKKHIKLPNQKYKKISLKCNFYYYFLHISSGKCFKEEIWGTREKWYTAIFKKEAQEQVAYTVSSRFESRKSWPGISPHQIRQQYYCKSNELFWLWSMQQLYNVIHQSRM